MPLCRHGSQEVKLTARPASWLKTIKSKGEIGRSLAVTDNSGTNVGDCKFPLLTTPLCSNMKWWGLSEGHTRTHTHTYFLFMQDMEDKPAEKKGWIGLTLAVGLVSWSHSFFFLQIALNFEKQLYKKPLTTSTCHLQASSCENYF